MGRTVWDRLSGWMGAGRVLRLMRLYPPYLGAGVRVRHVSDALDVVEVEMPLTALNRNYVGTHFGGSLYSMCDPFFMLLLLQRLGRDFVVWDKSARIDFLKPGRGTVRARFELPQARVDAIRAEAESQGRCRPEFEVDILDEAGEPVARIHKVLSVKPKARARS